MNNKHQQQHQQLLNNVINISEEEDQNSSLKITDEKFDSKLCWTSRMTNTFIEMYKKNRCLWDRSCPGYRIKRKRDQALDDMADEFNTNAVEVKRKIHNLRNQFNQEFQKIIKNHKQGREATSKWIYFKMLTFIVTGKLATRRSSFDEQTSIFERTYDDTVEMDQEEVEEDYEEMEIIKTEDVKRRMDELEEFHDESKSSDPLNVVVYENQIGMDEIVTPPAGTTRRRAESPNNEGIKSYVIEPIGSEQESFTKETIDEFTVFGQFVANELRAINDPQNRKKLKLAIQRAIIDISEIDE